MKGVSQRGAQLTYGAYGLKSLDSKWITARQIEAARIAKEGALFVLITHEIRLLQTILEGQDNWQIIAENRIALGGLNPRIFVLKRLEK